LATGEYYCIEKCLLMDFIQFVIGLAMILIGIAIIVSPELATVIAAVLVILGAVALYDAIYGTNK
jgi:hypothetical protein